MIRFLHFLVILANIAVIIEIADVHYIYKALRYNFVKIDNHDIFSHRIVEAGTGVPLPNAKDYNQKELPGALLKTFDQYRTVSFLVVQNDSVKSEHYWGVGAKDSYTNSFSMAKSVTSMLVGLAIHDGFIKGVDEPIGNYLPSFSEGEKAKITFKHLLQMASGLNWKESYILPISHTTESYYGTDLVKLVNKLEVVNEPGTVYYYKSGDTQLLNLALRQAIGKDLSTYTSEKLWKPLNAMHDAKWLLDHEDGNEKAYCCLISNARDFARLGLLYLHNGNWKGEQIIDSNYVQASIKPHLLPSLEDGMKPCNEYGYQWWSLDYKGEQIFYMRGILGQFILCVPSKNVVIVKLSHERSPRKDQAFEGVYQMLDFVDQAY